MSNTSQKAFTMPYSSIFAQSRAYERSLCIGKVGKNTKQASLMIKLLEKMYSDEPSISKEEFYNLTYNNVAVSISNINKKHPVFHLEKINDGLWQILDKRQIGYVL